MYMDRKKINFETLRIEGFKVKIGALKESIWVLEKSLKFVFEKGYEPWVKEAQCYDGEVGFSDTAPLCRVPE